jgi:hypothetical protein
MKRKKTKTRERFDPSESGSAWEWPIPLALFLVGLTILVVGASLVEGSRPAATLLGIALILVVYVPLTIAAMYLTASLLGMAFGFLNTAILKLAAISVFTLSLNQVGDWLGHPAVGWLVAILVSFYLFSNFFDLDFQETVLAVVVISVIRFCLGIGFFLLVGDLL